jgi:aspartate--ammonia ligase
MRAVRKDYFLDHDHSAYVDQWDWERAITADQRNLDFLKEIVGKIWKVLVETERYVQDLFPQLKTKYPNLPEKLTFLHAEDPPGHVSGPAAQAARNGHPAECPAIFIVGIGWTLADGYPHEMRAADYDDWVTPAVSRTAGKCTA